MKRPVLILLALCLTVGRLGAAPGENCKKCHCTSYPVGKECRNCCLLQSATDVIEKLIAASHRGIPEKIASRTTCLSIVPGSDTAASLFKNQPREGVVTCRTSGGWSAPLFIRLTGSESELGERRSDLLMLSTNERATQDFHRDEFEIGVGTGSFAGPIGRNAQADTSLRTGLLTYSQKQGIFSGADLNGISVTQDRDATNAFYGSQNSPEWILMGDVPVPEGARSFITAVERYFGSPSKSD